MPLVKEVIEEFKSGFKYLDESNHRQSKWYEFWYKLNVLKEECTDVNLTQVIEDAAKTCNDALVTLEDQYGHEDFAQHQKYFFRIIAQALYAVRVQRFAHGEFKTLNYQQGEKSILERVIIPKKMGVFEDKLLDGLKAVKTKFTDLETVMNDAIKKIKQSEQGRVSLFRESMRQNSRGEFSYSEPTENLSSLYHSIAEREATAGEYVSTLQF
ncbi:hypothetical protein [Legionella cardiaca]|uniref:Uncharacterized protein n=1 Tax=Legionella cardiaca TaxID=1071983 RepID=A0ABY8ANI6_9GAMM|nr:hypothetical protein [Legionella cardiaca]WED41816.1 hypothetical protein PXX05_07675 [Legionella cardiaca]